MIAEKGDWVRFYKLGVFVIGSIEYIKKDTLGYVHYYTDQGSIREDSVLEIRKKPQ